MALHHRWHFVERNIEALNAHPPTTVCAVLGRRGRDDNVRVSPWHMLPANAVVLPNHMHCGHVAMWPRARGFQSLQPSTYNFARAAARTAGGFVSCLSAVSLKSSSFPVELLTSAAANLRLCKLQLCAIGFAAAS